MSSRSRWPAGAPLSVFMCFPPSSSASDGFLGRSESLPRIWGVSASHDTCELASDCPRQRINLGGSKGLCSSVLAVGLPEYGGMAGTL